MLIKKITFLVFVMVMVNHVMAQIITDRPDQTESSSTVGAGNLQIESGILIGFDGDSQPSSRQLLAPTNLFRYGITNAIELRLLSQYEDVSVNSQSFTGVSDIEIGTKVQLLKDETRNTEIAFLTHIIVPSGTEELRNDKVGTINKLSISHTMTDKIGLGYNIGYNYFGEGKGDWTYSIALGVSVNSRVGIYIEPYGEWVEFDEFVSNVDTGVTYLANENLQFDLSFGTGINKHMNYISVGASWLLLSSE